LALETPNEGQVGVVLRAIYDIEQPSVRGDGRFVGSP